MVGHYIDIIVIIRMQDICKWIVALAFLQKLFTEICWLAMNAALTGLNFPAQVSSSFL